VIHFHEVTKRKGNGDDKDLGPVRNWPKTALALHPGRKALLRALAELQGTSERLIVEDALQRFYASLPPADQKRVSRALGGSPPASDTTRVECPAAIADAVRAFVRLWTEPEGKLEEAGRAGSVADAPALLKELESAFAQTRVHLLPLRDT